MSLLSVRNLGKAFRTYNSEWQRFASWFGIPAKPIDEHWVLRHANFDIQPGESVGIIGQNGAGKSTLLKMITGTLQPTEGVVNVKGRISAILELGMGFNPELSGRQNVIQAAGLMGFTADHINQVMPDIEAFAEIGEYFNEPVRTYSSGMQMRVAFSVAIAYRPEILIIDEALSVGDAHFQQKCFYQLEQYKKNGGTLLFVSHDLNTVKTLCERAILIENGRLVCDDQPKDVIDLYQAILTKQYDMSDKKILISNNNFFQEKATSVITNGDAELLDFKLLNSELNEVVYLESESVLKIIYKVRLLKKFERPAFGLIIRDKLGRSIFETSTYAMRLEEQPISKGLVEVDFSLNMNLKAGQYSFSVGVANKGYSRSEFEEYSLLIHDVQQIQVIESTDAIYYGGIFNMDPKVKVISHGDDECLE